MNIELKRCQKCQNQKPKNEFRINNAKKDGLDIYCKVCRKEYDSNLLKNPKRKTKKYIWFHPEYSIDGIGPYDYKEIRSYVEEFYPKEKPNNQYIFGEIIKDKITNVKGWVLDKNKFKNLYKLNNNWVFRNTEPKNTKPKNTKQIVQIPKSGQTEIQCKKCNETKSYIHFFQYQGNITHPCKECISTKKTKKQTVLNKKTLKQETRPQLTRDAKKIFELPKVRKCNKITNKSSKYLTKGEVEQLTCDIYNDRI